MFSRHSQESKQTRCYNFLHEMHLCLKKLDAGGMFSNHESFFIQMTVTI